MVHYKNSSFAILIVHYCKFIELYKYLTNKNRNDFSIKSSLFSNIKVKPYMIKIYSFKKIF